MQPHWHIDKHKKQPIYQQIIELIIDAIQTEKLLPGEKLPSERILADELQVNRSTVVKALEELASLGWISRKQGSGTSILEGRWGYRQAPLSYLRDSLNSPFLKEDPYVEKIAALKTHSDVIDLYTGELPDNLIPDFQLPAFSWEQVLKEEHKVTSTGYPLLQELILEHLKKKYAMNTIGQKLLITSGSTQGISLLMQVLLENGDCIITEDPSFLFALPLFTSMAIRLVGITQDSEGMIPEALDQALKEQKVKFVYLNPTFHNPTGHTMGIKRRKAIIAICKKHQVSIIEDDVFSELSLAENTPKLKTLAPESVIYLGSLSKVLGSPIKIGWLFAPEALIEKLAQAKQKMGLDTNIFPQLLSTSALQSADYEQKLAQLLKNLHKRKNAAAELLESFQQDWSFSPVQGGLYIWLTWKNQKLTRKDWQIFLEENCLVAPAFLFSNDTMSCRINYTRLSPEKLPLFEKKLRYITERLKA